jgi:hypothetical protein
VARSVCCARTPGAGLYRVLAAACEPVPAWDPVVYLADFACRVLVPLAAGAAGQEVAGTVAAAARLVRAVLDHQGGGLRDDATLLLVQWTGT